MITFNLAIKLAPDNGDAWFGLGIAHIGQENIKKGLKALDQALLINPENEEYWFAYARGNFEIDNIHYAKRGLENGLAINPEHTPAWIELFKIHLLLDKEFDTEFKKLIYTPVDMKTLYLFP